MRGAKLSSQIQPNAAKLTGWCAHGCNSSFNALLFNPLNQGMSLCLIIIYLCMFFHELRLRHCSKTVLSPGGIRCRSRPCASSIWLVRRTQPQPPSVVREQPGSGRKPRLYVNHRSDAKERRKRCRCPDTGTEAGLHFSPLLLQSQIILGSMWDEYWSPTKCLTFIFELIGFSQHEHRRPLAEFGFLLQGKAWKEKQKLFNFTKQRAQAHLFSNIIVHFQCHKGKKTNKNWPYLTLFHAETNLSLNLPVSSASWSSLLSSRPWGPADSVEKKTQSSMRSWAEDWPTNWAEEILGFITCEDDRDRVGRIAHYCHSSLHTQNK